MHTPTRLRRWLIFALMGWLGGTPWALAQDAGWQGRHDAGWQAYRAGRYADAERQLRAAAKEARSFGTGDPRLALALDHLAWVFSARGRYADAEPLAKWALAAREKRLGPVHREVAESLNTVACLYEMQGKHEQAEP
jgi:tetratricopeptide (TPR) repeat protein